MFTLGDMWYTIMVFLLGMVAGVRLGHVIDSDYQRRLDDE